MPPQAEPDLGRPLELQPTPTCGPTKRPGFKAGDRSALPALHLRILRWRADRSARGAGQLGSGHIDGRGEHLVSPGVSTHLTGAALECQVDWPKSLGARRKAELSLQGDWAYMMGDNRDHHFLRGDRITEETPPAAPGTRPWA
ncbi:hypothetical protein DFAR_2500021 [Desulfarculales bacterium]